MICAMELIRQTDRDLNLGDWPFEIGLWVGKSATPNRMGSTRQGDNDEDTARRRTLKYAAGDTRIPPIPLEKCPWCGTPFNKDSFKLTPPANAPRNLRIKCASIRCPFRGNERDLPIVAVDDSIYRRLPCFIIATVDKFAALPWLGRVGGFFGKVERYDNDGFYGPCDPGVGNALPGGRLLPPDLIVQDELHLISGPLGTIAGLYEAAIDELSANGAVRPKIIASRRVRSWSGSMRFRRLATECCCIRRVPTRRATLGGLVQAGAKDRGFCAKRAGVGRPLLERSGMRAAPPG